MAKPTKLFRICSLLLSIMFAYSASVQFNDPDWYFWFPLYASACVINVISRKILSKRIVVRNMAKLALLLGAFLFMKVVIEDFVNEIVGFWSLDLRERVAREKIGSGLVIISVILHLGASSRTRDHKQRKHKKIANFIDYGMAALVVFSYGLPFVFFVVQKGEMRL